MCKNQKEEASRALPWFRETGLQDMSSRWGSCLHKPPVRISAAMPRKFLKLIVCLGKQKMSVSLEESWEGVRK